MIKEDPRLLLTRLDRIHLSTSYEASSLVHHDDRTLFEHIFVHPTFPERNIVPVIVSVFVDHKDDEAAHGIGLSREQDVFRVPIQTRGVDKIYELKRQIL